MNFRTVYFLLLLAISFVLLSEVNAQDTNLVFGNKLMKQKINYYDLSDPLKVNFEVIAWGGFKNPGKYLVPEGTTLIDMLTFAGFPPNSELLEDVKLLRAKDISTKYESATVTKYNFKKFFDKKTIDYNIENPYVKPGDILLIPLEVERTFWDSVKEGLVIVGPLISLVSLIILINNSKTN